MRQTRLGDSTRLVGVDLARGLAVLGMLWVHFAPDGGDPALPDGRAAILFATLAGVSIGLLTGGARPPRGRARLAGLRTIAVRGAVLIVLGRLLSLLSTPIGVILDYYGVLFLLLLVLLFKPRWVLGLVVTVSVTVGAALVHAATPDQAAAFQSSNPLEWPRQWLVAGLYPVVVYIAYVCVGLISARSDLARPRTQVVMVVVGGVVAPLGYLTGGVLGVDAGPHTNSTWEALGSGGVAIATIGAMLLITTLRPVRVALAPIADVGAMPLTIYTGQVLAAALFLLSQPTALKYVIDYWWLLAIMVGGSLCFAVVWRRLIGRGPLEQVLAVLSHAPRPIIGSTTRVSSETAAQRARPLRTVTTGLLAGAIGGALVAGGAVLTPPERDQVTSIDVPRNATRKILTAAGTAAITLDATLTRQPDLRITAQGRGRRTAAVVAFPIIDGQVAASTEAVSGFVDLGGSGFVLRRGADDVRLSNLILDLRGGTVVGDLAVNGRPPTQGTLLFAVFPTSPTPGRATGDLLTVRHLQLAVPDTTAAAINEGLGADVVEANTVIATAMLSITG